MRSFVNLRKTGLIGLTFPWGGQNKRADTVGEFAKAIASCLARRRSSAFSNRYFLEKIGDARKKIGGVQTFPEFAQSKVNRLGQA
ncbi:MAG: hypothetical protein DBX55_01720 [Verrucomicrobia bacterium]|nr:MAG: hypothetical protein DBX55_01720 [Verrucomicrobiota bacterium]